MKKIDFMLCIAAVLLFNACSKSNNRPAPVNCDNLITDTTGTNDNAAIFAVTAFTPNGDGLNDMYRINTLDIASYTVSLYDDNNNVVFTGTQSTLGWGPSVAINAYAKYYYRIQATPNSSHQIGLCGNLYLLNCVPANADRTLFHFEDQLTQNGFTGVTSEAFTTTCN